MFTFIVHFLFCALPRCLWALSYQLHPKAVFLFWEGGQLHGSVLCVYQLGFWKPYGCFPECSNTCITTIPNFAGQFRQSDWLGLRGLYVWIISLSTVLLCFQGVLFPFFTLCAFSLFLLACWNTDFLCFRSDQLCDWGCFAFSTCLIVPWLVLFAVSADLICHGACLSFYQTTSLISQWGKDCLFTG